MTTTGKMKPAGMAGFIEWFYFIYCAAALAMGCGGSARG